MKTILIWSTSDTSHVRMSNLLAGLKNEPVKIIDLTIPVWKAEQNKAILGVLSIFWRMLHLLFTYLILTVRYLFAPKHDLVLVPYMGQIDLLVIKPLAWLRRKPVVWDIYISLYDTVVFDRKSISKSNLVAKLIYCLEWINFKLADITIADTEPHARYMKELFNLKKEPHVVHIGANSKEFYPMKKELKIPTDKFSVLFYGNLSPMHGVETIIQAAALLADETEIEFLIIGEGQSSKSIDDLIAEKQIKNVTRKSHVPYADLNKIINDSDIGLGVFADNPKGNNVVPNKAYQMLAAGIPIITADTVGMREVLIHNPLVKVVPFEDENALVNAILQLKQEPKNDRTERNLKAFSVTEKTVARQFLKVIDDAGV